MIMVMIFIMMIISIKWIWVFSLPGFFSWLFGGFFGGGSVRTEPQSKSDPWRPDLRTYFRSLLLASWCQTPRPLFGMIPISVIQPEEHLRSDIRVLVNKTRQCGPREGVLKGSAFNGIQTFTSS